MKQIPEINIPTGVRKSWTRIVYRHFLEIQTERFTKQFPQPLQPGDVVVLPKDVVSLFGGWERFSPKELAACGLHVPETAIVADVSTSSSWMEDTIFERNEDKLRFESTGSLLSSMYSILNSHENAPIYWSVRLEGVSWQWSVPAEFLTKKI